MIEVIMENKIDNLYGDEIIPEKVTIKMSYAEYLHYKSELKLWSEVSRKSCNTCAGQCKSDFCPNWGEPVVYRCPFWREKNGT